MTEHVLLHDAYFQTLPNRSAQGRVILTEKRTRARGISTHEVKTTRNSDIVICLTEPPPVSTRVRVCVRAPTFICKKRRVSGKR